MKSVADSLRELTASLHRERGEFERKVSERNHYLTLLMKLVGQTLPTSVEHYQPSNEYVTELVAEYMHGTKAPAPEETTDTLKTKRLHHGSLVQRGRDNRHESNVYRVVQVDRKRVCLLGITSSTRWMDAFERPEIGTEGWLNCAWLDKKQPCPEGWFPVNEKEETR